MTDNKKQKGASDDSVIFPGLDDSAVMADLATTDEEAPETSRGNQGFASMSKEKQRDIASKGGKAAHEAGTAHEWDSQEAAAAGRRGGLKKAA